MTGVRELSRAEGRTLFDRWARELWGISGCAWLRRYKAGKFAYAAACGPDHNRYVQMVLMLPMVEGGEQKYHNRRTWSALCNRWFESALEARHGEELCLRQLAGEITDLEFQVTYVLCAKPRVAVRLDYRHREVATGEVVVSDAKGVLTAEARVKYAWLKEKHGVHVRLLR